MEIVNLTPHDVVLVVGEKKIVFPPSGIVARCKTIKQTVGIIEVNGNNVMVNKSIFGEVENLPQQKPDTMYIVSSLVAQAAKDRDDLIIPDDTVRDDKGVIVGCKAFAIV